MIFELEIIVILKNVLAKVWLHAQIWLLHKKFTDFDTYDQFEPI
jgi:hypothetical protein